MHEFGANSRNEERENELISVNSGDEFAFQNAVNDNEIVVGDLVGNGLIAEPINVAIESNKSSNDEEVKETA